MVKAVGWTGPVPNLPVKLEDVKNFFDHAVKRLENCGLKLKKAAQVVAAFAKACFFVLAANLAFVKTVAASGVFGHASATTWAELENKADHAFAQLGVLLGTKGAEADVEKYASRFGNIYYQCLVLAPEDWIPPAGTEIMDDEKKKKEIEMEELNQ